MDTLLTDALWGAIALYLPEHPPSPKGGRPRVPDRDCLEGMISPTSARHVDTA